MGISDLSLTGTQSDITSCMYPWLLAPYHGVDKQQSEFFLETRVFISWEIIEVLLVDAASRKRSFSLQFRKLELEETYISARVQSFRPLKSVTGDIKVQFLLI